MRDRLMVGQRTLDPFIMVRIHVPQQKNLPRIQTFITLLISIYHHYERTKERRDLYRNI